MKRVYLDSNVFISLIRSEIGKPFKPMCQYTEEFFLLCKNNYCIILSDLTQNEINKITYLSKKEIIEFMKNYNITIAEVKTGKTDKAKSNKIRELGIHYPDSLHIALALKAKADCIVTWNIKDFEKAAKLIESKEPTELI